ncbi:MAG: hypothetical protein QOI95_4225 [Acidimicrobiaceae bacterium]|jgi:vacuolar-type H+-ATPase subunit B/Vma2
MSEHTKPSDETRAEEARQAGKAHDAGREATPEEAAAAEKQSVDPATRKAEEEMLERGAHQQGEGKPGV